MTINTIDERLAGNSQSADGRNSLADLRYQDRILDGVSRTFALTIPVLPGRLRTVVCNAYLLCRIADTIEDTPSLSLEEKKRFFDLFLAQLTGFAKVEALSERLPAWLCQGVTSEERDLIANSASVLRVMHSFKEDERAAIVRCVRIMSEGMHRFQNMQRNGGVEDVHDLDAYCYHVAGVVGEMLTDLFCAHSARIAAKRSELYPLAASFGQGLQTTNILKDIWDDQSRSMCWLPRRLFRKYGYELDQLSAGNVDDNFRAGLLELAALTRGHLEDALRYVLLIPRSEKRIRCFCLYAIGMAVLTLRNINRHPGFRSGDEVKISRFSVYATVLITRCIGRSNVFLKCVFALAARSLPPAG